MGQTKTVKDFFRAMHNVLDLDKNPDSGKLQQLLNSKKAGEYSLSVYAYRAWAIAELCCGCPEWDKDSLANVCWISLENPLVVELLRDIFRTFSTAEIPEATDNSLVPDVDIRLSLLNMLKRYEVSQARRFGIELHDHLGRKF